MPRIDTLSVLVLDDHLFMQQVLRAILTGLGIKNVVAATDIEEAIRRVQTERFDIMFSDYRLGGPTGADFVKLVRASHDGYDRFVPIIACTADTAKSVVQELRDAGVDEILAKPVSAQAVWTKLTAVVNARRPFVVAPGFFGPDRRRRHKPGAAPDRRKTPAPQRS